MMTIFDFLLNSYHIVGVGLSLVSLVSILFFAVFRIRCVIVYSTVFVLVIVNSIIPLALYIIFCLQSSLTAPYCDLPIDIRLSLNYFQVSRLKLHSPLFWRYYRNLIVEINFYQVFHFFIIFLTDSSCLLYQMFL